jgi:hypothetical protein
MEGQLALGRAKLITVTGGRGRYAQNEGKQTDKKKRNPLDNGAAS